MDIGYVIGYAIGVLIGSAIFFVPMAILERIGHRRKVKRYLEYIRDRRSFEEERTIQQMKYLDRKYDQEYRQMDRGHKEHRF